MASRCRAGTTTRPAQNRLTLPTITNLNRAVDRQLQRDVLRRRHSTRPVLTALADSESVHRDLQLLRHRDTPVRRDKRIGEDEIDKLVSRETKYYPYIRHPKGGGIGGDSERRGGGGANRSIAQRRTQSQRFRASTPCMRSCTSTSSSTRCDRLYGSSNAS